VAVERVARRLITADAFLVSSLNRIVRRSATLRALASILAVRLSTVEIVLMGALVVGGRPRAAIRMLLAVALVYLASEALGAAWRRERPFAQLASEIEPLTSHASGRSFPSRHVASGLAMASVGHAAHPRLGRTMTIVAWLLGFSRVAAGLHYPSDVLAGAVVGLWIGRLLR
jgi:undecaprenyl-diphosphatase